MNATFATAAKVPSDIRGRTLFFWGAPLSSITLLFIVLAYGLTTGFDYFTPISLGASDSFLPISFYQLVIVLWFFSVDGSHLFHTLARAFLLPEVFRKHRKSIVFSFAFFIAGPVAVIWPALMSGAFLIEPGTDARRIVNSLPVALLSLYFLWAYWHVTRQHWGFVAIRARLRGSAPSARHRAFHTFSTALPPVIFFLVDGHVKIAANQALSTAGLLSSLGVSKIQVVGTGACLFAIAVILTFVARWPEKHNGDSNTLPRDGSSSFLLVSTGALHLAVMSIEPLALFVHPIITLGHDLQYHAICYLEGRARSKATREEGRIAGHAERFFYWLHERRYGIFLAALAFAFFSTSPLLLSETVASLLAQAPFPLSNGEDVRVAVNASTYFLPPPLESQLLNAFCIGFAAQHYYIDGKIWQLSQDHSTRVSVMSALQKPA